MQYKAYSIFDSKALTYSPPFFQTTDGSAIRMLSDLANDQGTQIGRHPKDFVLFCVGSYDDQKGAMSPVSPLLHVMDAVALVKLQPMMNFKAPVNPDGSPMKYEDFAAANGHDRSSSNLK